LHILRVDQGAHCPEVYLKWGRAVEIQPAVQSNPDLAAIYRCVSSRREPQDELKEWRLSALFIMDFIDKVW
jgi:hypothetical protein